MKTLKQNIWLIATLAILLAFNLAMNHSFFDIRVVNGHLFGSLIDIMFRAVSTSAHSTWHDVSHCDWRS